MQELSQENLEFLADAIAQRLAERLAARVTRRYVSRQEYADARGLGVRTVDRAIAEGRLPVMRQGRRVLIGTDSEIEPP